MGGATPVAPPRAGVWAAPPEVAGSLLVVPGAGKGLEQPAFAG